jgi:hypothetical protein
LGNNPFFLDPLFSYFLHLSLSGILPITPRGNSLFRRFGPMEFFFTTQLAVPLLQVIALLTLVTAGLLLGRTKLTLLITYLFMLYWAYVLDADLFNSLHKLNAFTSSYLGFGLVVTALAAIGFLGRRG